MADEINLQMERSPLTRGATVWRMVHQGWTDPKTKQRRFWPEECLDEDWIIRQKLHRRQPSHEDRVRAKEALHSFLTRRQA